MLLKLECSPKSSWRGKAKKVFSSKRSLEVVVNVIGIAKRYKVQRAYSALQKTIHENHCQLVHACRRGLQEISDGVSFSLIGIQGE